MHEPDILTLRRHVTTFPLPRVTPRPSISGFMEPPGTQWPCIKFHPDGVGLSLKVSPNAKTNEARGLWQGRLRVRIQAPAVDGKANEALRKWIAKVFGIRSREVKILSGERSQRKTLLLEGMTIDDARQVLDRL